MTLPSLGRIAAGLVWAIAVGVPCGILIGRFRSVREACAVPFQFLRMISPLAWMPIAIYGVQHLERRHRISHRRCRDMANSVFHRTWLSAD